VGRYLRGTLLECLLFGGSVSVGLTLIGVSVPVALLIGLISAITNVIPFLGHIIALCVGLSYALIAENIHPVLPFIGPDDLFLGVIFVVGIAHLLDNVIYQPIVLGGTVHPLVVILAVGSGSLAFGFTGMLMAVPLVVITKTVIRTLFKELNAYRII
jgi:predicted PurR-regulated permease PerM